MDHGIKAKFAADNKPMGDLNQIHEALIIL